jgi:hypothetical protein
VQTHHEHTYDSSIFIFRNGVSDLRETQHKVAQPLALLLDDGVQLDERPRAFEPSLELAD